MTSKCVNNSSNSKFSGLSEFSETSQTNKTSFFSLSLEHNGVTFLPGFDYECLTWEHMTDEPAADCFEKRGITVAVGVVDHFSSKSISAESMQDRSLESTDLREVLIDVKGIDIPIQSVQDSLIRISLAAYNLVRWTLRNCRIVDYGWLSLGSKVFYTSENKDSDNLNV